MTLDGAFTNKRWRLQAGTLCKGCTHAWRVFLCLLNRLNTFLSSYFFCQLRYDVSQGEWVRCNMRIQKMCHYPVFGLKEGSLYQFRVCAVNKAGVGRPSKASEPVCTVDPLKHTRTAGMKQTGHWKNKWNTVKFKRIQAKINKKFLLSNICHICPKRVPSPQVIWTLLSFL